LVLLKNENEVLPISKESDLIFVAGQSANDIGMQCGGWTIEWQGAMGDITPGTTILEGIQAAVSDGTKVIYQENGDFDAATKADVTIVVVGELPYAEGVGDREDLTLFATDIELIERARETSHRLVVIILSGRPLIITEQFPLADAWVAAWLPGTEGDGVSDVLFGDYAFTGKLSYTWPRSNEQLPININNVGEATGCEAPLFPFGFGLGEAGSEPIEWIECP
jgi:beta-glucosidase